MLNKKALTIFLSLTFGLTVTLCLIAKFNGLSLVGTPLISSQLVVLGAMFIPAVSALVTQKFIVKKPLKELGIKFGPLSMYLKTYAIIFLLFLINYSFTALFLLKPDFTLNSFMQQFGGNLTLPMPAERMVLLLSLVTFITSPLLNIIPSLGEEIGWRGFLLPNLEPLGKGKAMILSSMIWALWHTPLILILGFMYGKDIWPGVLLHFLLVTSFGIWMGSVWFKTRSTILAAFMHSTFNANAYGIWAILFVTDSKLIVGAAGIVGVSLWLILGMITLLNFKDTK